jgi:AcrR family transcriptional regulator
LASDEVAPVSPKVVDRDQRKREIALAALDLFAEKGFEATPISQIAEAAGISKGSVYLYFTSKEDLIFHAVGTWVDQIMEQTGSEVPADMPPPQRLRTLVHAVVEVFISDERSVRIAVAIFQLFLTNPRMLDRRDFARESLQGARRAITDVLTDGVSQGVFRPETAREAESVAINLLAYLDGIALHYYMSRSYFDLMSQVDMYLDHLLRSLTDLNRRPGAQA